jgi:hypothetical protein
MIVGYTDRLIRVYGWVNGNNNNGASSANSKNSSSTLNSSSYNYTFQEVGKFVLEQSWELLDQVK